MGRRGRRRRARDAARLDFHGIAQVEWKRDPRDGALKLIEVNPRLWQWRGLTGECGAGVIEIAYWDLIGVARAAHGRQSKALGDLLDERARDGVP